MRIHFAWLTKATRSGIGLALMLTALSTPAWAVPHLTPEIDPGSMGSALTLLFGGAMLLRRRFRKS
jgi:hypothetical protein